MAETQADRTIQDPLQDPQMSGQDGWAIEFRDVSVGWGTHVVLHDIEALLPAGRISVILGGSGCGKSTLLRHIMGLARPLSGEILVAGQSLFSLDSRAFRNIRRNMGVLFQDGALLGAMRVWENVALPLTEHLALPGSVVRQEALRVLEMVELSDFADFYPNELSGGMRKRAGLARAIITNPRILLCDEPTSGLDPITAARMDALISFLHRTFPQMTIVTVSHDLASLERIAEHVMVLRDGECLFTGTRDELHASSDSYIQQFLKRDPDMYRDTFAEHMQPGVASALAEWKNENR